LIHISLLWHSDPHVRVAGEPESVRAAKERIMAVLDTRVKTKNCLIANRCIYIM